jgi:hypothetical protein
MLSLQLWGAEPEEAGHKVVERLHKVVERPHVVFAGMGS